MREFDWQYRLFVDRKIYLAINRLQADKGLGKSFSALLPLVEGLHTMGYLEDGDFEVYKAKYSAGLDIEPLTATQIKQKETKENRDRQLNRHYAEVLEQWNLLTEKTKSFHLKKAAKDRHLKFARKVLEKGNTDNRGSEDGKI